jgi:hypothetical protein
MDKRFNKFCGILRSYWQFKRYWIVWLGAVVLMLLGFVTIVLCAGPLMGVLLVYILFYGSRCPACHKLWALERISQEYHHSYTSYTVMCKHCGHTFSWSKNNSKNF